MSVEDSGGDYALFVADIAGTLIFAIEGAVAAVRGNLDLMGLTVLAFATALGGGIIRDLLIGDMPPASLKDWRYAATAFAGAAMVFCLHRPVERYMDGSIVILDAAGLSLFAIVGTRKALVYGLHPLVAVLLGRSAEWAAERYAMFCWRRCRRCCARMCMRRRHWPGRL